MLDINKQKMQYALQNGRMPVYETDDEGNIKHIEIDGEQVPVETGEYMASYEEPVSFCANISNKLSEVLIKEFGVDNSALFVQIVADKGKLPLAIGALVWKESAVGYKETSKTMLDENSADYVVKGVADEGLTVDLFLLQKNVK